MSKNQYQNTLFLCFRASPGSSCWLFLFSVLSALHRMAWSLCTLIAASANPFSPARCFPRFSIQHGHLTAPRCKRSFMLRRQFRRRFGGSGGILCVYGSASNTAVRSKSSPNFRAVRCFVLSNVRYDNLPRLSLTVTPCCGGFLCVVFRQYLQSRKREFVKISFCPPSTDSMQICQTGENISFYFPFHGIILAIFENTKNGLKKTGNLFLISCFMYRSVCTAVIQFLVGYNSTNWN